MPNISDILNSYNNLNNNNKKLTMKDILIANAKNNAENELLPLSEYPNKENISQLSEYPETQNQNIDNVVMPQQASNQLTLENIYKNKPDINNVKTQKPYSIKDIASYWKVDEKTGEKPSKWKAVLKSIGTLLNTKEGMNLVGLATLATGGSPYMAKAFSDQGQQIEASNLRQQELYNKNLEDIRNTSTAYDMKLLDILGKEGYQRLKGGQGQLIGDRESGKVYLPETTEQGDITLSEVNPNDYKGYNINWKYKQEKTAEEKIKEASGITEAKGKAYNQSLLERENLLRNPKTQTAQAIKQAQQDIELSNLPQKQELEIQKATKQEQNIRLNKLNEMDKVIDFFENKINEIPVGSGVSGRIQGALIGLEGKAGLNPKATAYQANLEGLRSQIARGLGEVGNLAENEQKYAMSLLPNITDNMEVRNQKIKNFRDYIKVKLGKNIGEQKSSKYKIVGVE